MRKMFIVSSIAAIAIASIGLGQAPAAGPYKILKTAKVGGEGTFDYVYADVDGRKLYIPRTGNAPGPRITVFNLDTQAPIGEIPMVSARGAAVDPKSGHGFVSSKPVVMFDTKTLAVLKTIDVQGNPDGILFDPFNQRVYVLSHAAPNATVINSVDGSVIGTIDLGGQPEQAASNGKGTIYVDLEDKDSIAVVDAKTMKLTATYSLMGKGGAPAGLGFDVKNNILFAACAMPATMVILNAADGKIITSLPIGNGVDGAGFNPNTMEAFSSQRDGTLTVVKENSPTSFAVEQTVQTMTGAKTMTIDTMTNHVLLIAAEIAPPAAPAAPGARGGRGQAVPGSFSIIVVGK